MITIRAGRGVKVSSSFQQLARHNMSKLKLIGEGANASVYSGCWSVQEGEEKKNVFVACRFTATQTSFEFNRSLLIQRNLYDQGISIPYIHDKGIMGPLHYSISEYRGDNCQKILSSNLPRHQN